MKILLTGATGLLGRALIFELYRHGHEVTVLGRTDPKQFCQFVFWKALTEPLPSTVFAPSDSGKPPFDAVIHLAGDPIANGRWTKARKKSILESRVLGTRNLVNAIQALSEVHRPKVFLLGSAIGIYGNAADLELDESSQSGNGFLAEVTVAWENELAALDPSIRRASLRTAVVLANEGGALEKMGPAIVGNGKQFFSWIHLQDWARATRFILEHDAAKGPINLSSPQPSPFSEFIEALDRVKHYPMILPAPEIALRLALGEFADALLFSQRVFPKRLLDLGFQFQFPTLDLALADLFRDSRNYLDTVFQATQFVPKPRSEVFAFFSDASNLGKITPPWLNFAILNQSTPKIEKGTIIDYQLKIHGVPAKWQTLIADWNPEESFVDTQRKGPYAYWHHEHRFESVASGTLIHDRIAYRPPVGLPGKLFGGAFLASDIRKIFAHRQAHIPSLLGL